MKSARVKSRAPREHGRHYTPAELARRMVQEGLASAEGPARAAPLRILDPACGDGAFLLEVFDSLCAQDAQAGRTKSGDAGLDSAARLRVVREQIFGCDIDGVAVTSLRQALLDRIQVVGAMAHEAQHIVESNVRVGDALLGSGFESGFEPGARQATLWEDEPVLSAHGVPVINWGADFPAVAERGGFDLIVGNPPYLRERDARELFERIAETPLGRRWREARMDLWYYFAHRALDLLRPGGVLTFVVNSYWTASLGARKLIARFEAETSLEEIELLGTRPIFTGVAGRHLIFRLRKNPLEASLPILAAPRASVSSVSPDEHPETHCTIIPNGASPYLVRHVDLYQSGRLVLFPPVRLDSVSGPTRPLGNVFDTRQGIAENPPAINRRLMRSAPGDFVLGEGVFVLRPEEVERLQLSEEERGLLRPYYDTSVISRYHIPEGPTHQILYLTRQTAPSLAGIPQLHKHLERFRSILDRRRETQEGTNDWWHLHWPRDESNFVSPRLLSVQMGKRPQFVFATGPTFVGFSVNLILAGGEASISLAALAGILNSECAREWFERHAKRRGIHVEINAHVLRQFPLPAADEPVDAEIADLVKQRQTCDAGSPAAGQLEAQIERLVQRWYRLPELTSADERTSSTP